MNYCSYGGSLVGTVYWLPSEPHDFDFGGRAGPIGCNHIVCGQCGDLVQAFDGCQVAEGHYLQAGQLRGVANWHGCDKLVAFAPARLYFCACSVRQCFGFEELDPPPDSLRSPGPWSCGGHLTLPASSVVDGVTIGPGTLWSELIKAVVQGRLPVHPPWPEAIDAKWPALWLFRLCSLVGTPSERNAIASAALTHLGSADAGELNRVVQLFYMDPTLPGGAELAATLARRGAYYWQVQEQTGNGLYFAVVFAVGRLALLADDRGSTVPQAVDAAKSELLAARPSLALLHAVAVADPSWLLHNLEAIAAAHPADVETIALSLHSRDRVLWQPPLLRLGLHSAVWRQAVLAALARNLSADDLRQAAEQMHTN